MLSDITFGQYYPGNSLLHNADPRIKILILIAFMTAALGASSETAFICVALLTAFLLAASELSLRILLKGMKPLILLLAFTAILNLFFVTGETPVFEFYFIHIYVESIINAVKMVLRLVCLFLGTAVILTYTTSPFDMTDALERLLKPLTYIKVPVHDFAMMMTIALRFVPTLAEETDKIINAQKSRGSDFETGGALKRVKAMIPILVPLFSSAIRRAYELADAMECRCYNGGVGRTKMKILKYKLSDFVFLILMIAFTVGIFFINRVTFL